MKPVFQLRPNLTNGDCLDCAIASILEIPLSEMPDLAIETDNAKWWNGVQDFLRTWGFQLLMVELTDKTPWYAMPASPWCILIGEAAKTGLHAVVGRTDFPINGQPAQFVLIHDPLDGAGGDITVKQVCFLVPIDPRKAIPERKFIQEVIHGAHVGAVVGKEAGAPRKAYMLTSTSIGGGHGEGPVQHISINRVFSSRESAQQYIDTHPDECWYNPGIVEVPLDMEAGRGCGAGRYKVREYWPGFVDRSDEPREAYVANPQDALQVDWLKSKGSLRLSDDNTLVMKDQYVVATIRENGQAQ